MKNIFLLILLFSCFTLFAQLDPVPTPKEYAVPTKEAFDDGENYCKIVGEYKHAVIFNTAEGRPQSIRFHSYKKRGKNYLISINMQEKQKGKVKNFCIVFKIPKRDIVMIE